jgi:FAD:protein FMN transferase
MRIYRINKIIIVIIILVLFIIVLTSCEYKQTKEVMSTFSEIKSNNNKKINEAYKEIEKVQSTMNVYDEKTEIAELNREKEIQASEELFYVVNKSAYYSQISNGSFDITVLPLILLYKNSFEQMKRAPNEEEIGNELKMVGYKNLIFEKGIIEDFDGKKGISKERDWIKLQNNASIDLGGIAKGYAIDRALEKLDNGIVNLGGQVGVKGNKKHKIALVNPDNKDEFITRFELSNGCISTSGNYERYFDKSKQNHHILDPKTGKSAQGLISVTIIGDNKKGIDCDALSTSVFVMGKERGIELINNIDGFYAFIIDENDSIIRSNGIEKYEIE